MVPAAEGQRAAHQPSRPLLLDRHRGRHLPPPAEGAGGLVPLHRRPVPVLRRRPLHVQLSEALRCRGGVPVARRRHLPDGLPRSRRRIADPRQAAKPEGRPCSGDRLTHSHRRHRPDFVGLPRRSEHPPLRPDRPSRRRYPPRTHSGTSSSSPRPSVSLSTRASAPQPSTCSSEASSRSSQSTPPTRTRSSPMPTTTS